MYSATIHLDTHDHCGKIDRRIFGGFLEHLGRAIYGGVYDPTSPLSDARGFRLDVIGKLRELRMPIIRYPGGNFVSSYNWRDGVGPRDARPSRKDFAWKSIESNQFGVDEFMRWINTLGAEPMMAVNLGTAGAKEAAELLEYCNLPDSPTFSQLRAANASAYKIKLWCLGNEMDGPWQAGHCTAIEYAHRAREASQLMKRLDPSIQTIACGSSGTFLETYMHWDRTVLEECWETIDYISAHRYSENVRGDSAWFLAEGVAIDRVLEDYVGLIESIRAGKKSDKRIYISFDEWNVWYRAKNGDGGWQEAPPLLEEVYNLEDALVCAQYLNAFIRHADIVKIACLAQIVNVLAPILTSRDSMLIQSIFHPIEMIAKSAVGNSLRLKIDSPSYLAGERGKVPSIDAAASFDEDTGKLSAFIVNRQLDGSAKVTLKLADRSISSVSFSGAIGGQHPEMANSWEHPHAVKRFAAKVQIVDGSAIVQVPEPGFVAITFETSPR